MKRNYFNSKLNILVKFVYRIKLSQRFLTANVPRVGHPLRPRLRKSNRHLGIIHCLSNPSF